MHEDLLLHLTVQPVAGTAVGGDDDPEADREALLVGPARRRIDRRALAAARAGRPRCGPGRAWRGCPSGVGAGRCGGPRPATGRWRGGAAAGGRAPTRPGSRTRWPAAAATRPVTATVPVTGSTSNHVGPSIIASGGMRRSRDRLQHLVGVDAAVAEGARPSPASSGSARCRAAATRSACRSCWPGRRRSAWRSRRRRRWPARSASPRWRSARSCPAARGSDGWRRHALLAGVALEQADHPGRLAGGLRRARSSRAPRRTCGRRSSCSR